MRSLIVLPSYNESLNIVRLVDSILDGNAECDVCIVDDSSPDGTASCIIDAVSSRPAWGLRVKLISRARKDGRGGAVREGLQWGMRQGCYTAFVEMDCDFSHDPAALCEGLSRITGGGDVVVGARYPDGTIVGWPWSRRVFSYCANLLARVLIDRRVADYTNGFRFYSGSAVQELLRHEQRHTGYIYLSESMSYLLRAGLAVDAFPIVFRDRERGASNTTLREVSSSLWGIVAIALRHRRKGRGR